MMVIRGTVDTTITSAGFASGDTRIFPADRCVWEHSSTSIPTVESPRCPTSTSCRGRSVAIENHIGS